MTTVVTIERSIAASTLVKGNRNTQSKVDMRKQIPTPVALGFPAKLAKPVSEAFSRKKAMPTIVDLERAPDTISAIIHVKYGSLFINSVRAKAFTEIAIISASVPYTPI